MTDWIRELAARAASFFRKMARDEEFDEEMAAHLEFAVQEHLRRGMPLDEARRHALVAIGGVSQARELHRESRGLPRLETILQDLRYAGRTLRRDAGLTAFAVLMIGLGVGASCTVFSVLNALLLRPLPFTDPDQLVWIANGTSENLSAQTTQVANLRDLQAQSASFAGIGGYSPFYGAGDILLSGSGEPERLTGVPVTESFFPLLGLKPRLGRFFSAEECRWKAPKSVVLSHGFWQRRFAGDPGVVGRQLTLDGEPASVIGVMPAEFDFAATFTPGSRADLFYPFPLTPETNRQGNTLALIGRLRAGANLATAQAEANVVGERIRNAVDLDRFRNGFRPRLSPLRDRVSGRFRYALVVLAGAVAFLMLLVCANLSNLLLARASARKKEMAIRTALGAGRGRLIGQMLIESMVLASAGAALGLGLAIGSTTLLARLPAANIPPAAIGSYRRRSPGVHSIDIGADRYRVWDGAGAAGFRHGSYRSDERVRAGIDRKRTRLDARIPGGLRDRAGRGPADGSGPIDGEPDPRPPRGSWIRHRKPAGPSCRPGQSVHLAGAKAGLFR